jgi:hypothetical protein
MFSEEFAFTVICSIFPTAIFMSAIVVLGLRVWREQVQYKQILIALFPLIVVANIVSRIALSSVVGTNLDTLEVATFIMILLFLIPPIGTYYYLRFIKSSAPLYKLLILYAIGIGIGSLFLKMFGL